ncbi:GNAT family N-acetyltransferase [Pontibacter sp. H249]|uniref:GNAT family N-acetyltransferase n=1 Tax=Pontibacter sp. H249 TaxID=3133420 RepID=UPI0030BD79BF
MLRYLPHNEINEKNWNDCVKASTQSIIYAFSWYLNAVCKRWDAVVEMDEQGMYTSVFPLPLGRRFGQLGVLQPYFTQQLGLFTTPQSKYKSIADYLPLIPQKYKSIYLQLNTANTENALHNPQRLLAKERVTYHLQLQQSYPELYSRYSTNQKRNIRKAEKAGVAVCELKDIKTLISLFKSTKGKELTEVKEKHYRMLANLFATLEQRGFADLVQATAADGEVLAAALLAHQPDKIIFLFGASSDAGKKYGAMAFLLDSITKKYSATSRILDFEGSMEPTVAKFYANFGATPVTYVSLSRQHTPWYLIWKEAISTS